MFKYVIIVAMTLFTLSATFVLFCLMNSYFQKLYIRPKIDVSVTLTDHPTQPVLITIVSKTEGTKETTKLVAPAKTSIVLQPIVDIQGAGGLIPGDRYIKTQLECSAVGYQQVVAYVSIHNAELSTKNPAPRFKIEFEMRPLTSQQHSKYIPYRYDPRHKTWNIYRDFILPP